jgi:glutathione S-transferase
MLIGRGSQVVAKRSGQPLCRQDRVRDPLGELPRRLGRADWLDGAFSAGDLMMVAVLLRLKPSGRQATDRLMKASSGLT